MNSSGLIYAVIVGAWAAYLVPMWLRRQDELNESRPTERFSTAIRLLSGKAAMERRYARENERRGGEDPEENGDLPLPDGSRVAEHDEVPHAADELDGADDLDDLDGADESVDVRAFADPKTIVGDDATGAPTEVLGAATAKPASVSSPVPGSASASAASGDRAGGGDAGARGGDGRSKAERDKARQKNKRAKVLARRRRTTMVLFLAFTAGTIVAAVGGLAFLWAPGVPGVLLSAYIVHLRVQERRRFARTMDKRRAEPATREPHAQTGDEEAATEGAPGVETGGFHAPAGQSTAPERASGAHREEPAAADRRALVEQTDHAEWVDQQRDGDRVPDGGWDPVPVPLPTYVSAPVAPRSTRGVDLEAPGTWSSARSSSAAGEPQPFARPGQHQDEESSAPVSGTGRGRGRRQTPLFDQYEDGERPRAANE
ncbi:divisome protein SepX/GlpR [Streptomyces marispadix]|uniref:Uncharacterized protein n=1 Tax=Streptomyces marispadix TaxID=2922868 RepID=A0ABS9SX65_9ACTN|nr:gephyrin-like molybdotransferase receptor GlpR [Streptomyces marispadix]MCH6160783.1 hypothetical protein [Streptomyces marispadix]